MRPRMRGWRRRRLQPRALLDNDVAAANAEIHSRRITLEGGYVAVYRTG